MEGSDDANEGHEEEVEGRGILIYVLINRIFIFHYPMKKIW